MRPLLATLAILALLTFLPTPASAQQQGMVTVVLQAPAEALSEDVKTLTIQGIATLTTDITGYANLMGIPVAYTVSGAPSWANVLVSPASDVFSFGQPTGASMTSTRAFTVTVTAKDPGMDVTDLVEITAQTTPGLLGASFTGIGTAHVAYDAPETDPCPDHPLGDADWGALAVEAADAYNAHQAAQSGSGDDVTVQTGRSSTLPTPWIVVGGFALIGAGVGLVLRRKLGS